MATIILTTIGTALGGPLGGMIGAALGQQVDRAVLGPKSVREGPRLKELDVQTSSYGTQIPAIFGAMRTAGTVIWATDLVEHRSKSGGGKGRPKTVEYSYSANMAVALSSHPVSHVGRIWAEGNILRGAAGDFKVETEFRFYCGNDDQMADPLIASAEGPAHCPAYRGIAYAVFEGLQLADYGNRIPSLTFEIFERDGGVRLVDIAAAISGGLIVGDSEEAVAGYAAAGDNIRNALAPLFDVEPCLIRAEGEQMRVMDWLSDGHAAATQEVASLGKSGFDRARQQLQSAALLPATITIRHYDPARDYNLGSQRMQRGASGAVEKQIDLPASIDSAIALRMADLQLLQSRRSRRSLEGHFICRNDIRPGDWVAIADDAQPWRVVETEYIHGIRKLKATRFLSGDVGFAAASPGRNMPSPDLEIGATRIVLADLPAVDTADPGSPLIVVFAAGTGAGWRRAALSIQSGDGDRDAGETAASATIGFAIDRLARHSPWLLDDSNSLNVQLLRRDMDLPAGSGNPLSTDAPMVWLGGEIIRYGRAEHTGPGQYLLSNLARGCFGTEAQIDNHVAGDDFVLLEPETAKRLDPAGLAVGQGLIVQALGVGENQPATAQIDVAGNALRPLPPVHLDAKMTNGGGLQIGWIRRARLDYGWQDQVDLQLCEDSETYMVQILADGSLLGEWVSSFNGLYLTSDIVAALDLPSRESVMISVVQKGRHAVSLPTNMVTRFFSSERES